MKTVALAKADPSHAARVGGESSRLIRSALARLYTLARSEGYVNTAMTLELALTAVGVDSETRRI